MYVNSVREEFKKKSNEIKRGKGDLLPLKKNQTFSR